MYAWLFHKIVFRGVRSYIVTAPAAEHTTHTHPNEYKKMSVEEQNNIEQKKK